MPRLPRVTASQVIKVIEKMGFVLTRQTGSHKIYRNREGKRVTVPYHAAQTLHLKLLKSILQDAGLSVEEFVKRLKQ